MGAYPAIGIFAHFIYVNPTSNLVLAKCGPQPKPVGKETVDEYEFLNALARTLE